MILIDVNVLVYACRRDAERHAEYHEWLEETLSAGEPVGIAPESLGAVVRITTHHRLWKEPLPLEQALAFTTAVQLAASMHAVMPGPAHWDLFATLCRESKARGSIVSDVWLAALAIDQGCTLVTTDRDFARFKSLRWRHPLNG